MLRSDFLRIQSKLRDEKIKKRTHEVLSNLLATKSGNNEKIKYASKKYSKNSLIQKRVKKKKLKDHSKNISNLFSSSMNYDDSNDLSNVIHKKISSNFELESDKITKCNSKKFKKNNKIEGSISNFKKIGMKRKHSQSEEKSSQKKSKIQQSKDKSDSEEEIRNELQSSSIFKNIQKLIKENPSLFSDTGDNEEERTESVENASESEELSKEYLDDVYSDSTDEELDLPTKNSFISKIDKKKKVGLTSEKNLDKLRDKKCKDPSKNLADSGLIVNKEEKLTSKKKLNDFERFQLSSNVKSDKEKKVSEIVTSPVVFNRSKKESLISQEGKTNPKKPSSSLRNKALGKLQGAKFRYLNEKMYTESGKESFKYFQTNEDEYLDYHQGYSLQVTKWPINPVNKIIESLQKINKKLTIADMGCGDAKIAQSLPDCTVHSFDLVALNEHVTPCNMSKVPLPNESVDVVVFCLSLMGTNLKEYIQEAYRISKFGGILKIAEVESRVPDLGKFIKNILFLGFSLVKKDVDTKLFVFLEFKKDKKKKQGAKVKDLSLKPCLYKKR